ncbi:hypothetical protein, partial [Staphylococcus simulans]|uniref:hypothetical protein n=1 Tax=Staphylococcus simulans TaxID=1286 RepID=UPI000D1F00B9
SYETSKFPLKLKIKALKVFVSLAINFVKKNGDIFMKFREALENFLSSKYVYVVLVILVIYQIFMLFK